MDKLTPLTEEEHIARAMLLGMRYHEGNGDPFYYAVNDVGDVIISSMTDANTLEPVGDPIRTIDDIRRDITRKPRNKRTVQWIV